MTMPFLRLVEDACPTLPVRQCRLAISRFAVPSRLPVTFGTLQGGRVIEKLRENAGAGLKVALPGCEAVIVQEPTPFRCTTVPLTVQSPLAVKEPGSPDEASA